MVNNASIVTFGSNASAMVISYECDYRTGNVPIDVLGRNRNDYQDLGLFPTEHHFTLFTENNSQYRNLLQELYKHEEIEFGYNESTKFYGVPTHIHKHPMQAGKIKDLYIVDVDILSTDPLRYGKKFEASYTLTGKSGSFNAPAVIGDTKTPICLHFDVYDVNRKTVTGSDTGSYLSFGRKDQLGFDHIYKMYIYTPIWREFWDNYDWQSKYILPPLNLTSGTIDCGSTQRTWKWGPDPKLIRINRKEIIRYLWLKDDQYYDFPYTDTAFKRIPSVCSEVAPLSNRLTIAQGILFLDLQGDTNIESIHISGEIRVPEIDGPWNDRTDGVNLYIWNNINKSWDPLLIYNPYPREVNSGEKHIDVTIKDTGGIINYSSAWNVSGGLAFLFFNQKHGTAGGDYGWDLMIGAQRWVENSTLAIHSTGTDYLRMRVFRKNHRVATIIPRDYEILQYAIIKGVNNIPNNTIQIHIVNAASDAIGEFVYRTIEIPSNNWDGEHLIPLASINYLPNASYIGIVVQLKEELLNAGILPGVELYNMAGTLTLEFNGGEIEADTQIYGIQKESVIHITNTYSGKSILKEYGQGETLNVIEIHDELEPYRITRLQGPWIQGHYELNSKVSDKFTFDPFENIENSYYEKIGEVSISPSLVDLGSGSITYLISPNLPIIEVPTLYLKGSVSHIYLSGENESFYEVSYISNHTGYLGSSEIDLRGRERFFLKLQGGSFSALHVGCDLGSVYNPLPWAVPNGPTTYYYSKDKDIDVDLSVEYRAAYYT